LFFESGRYAYVAQYVTGFFLKKKKKVEFKIAMAEKFTNIPSAIAALYVTVYTAALFNNVIRNSWNFSKTGTLFY
jgi:hypothetical protein